MDLETALADPALDLPVPPNGLAQVHSRARAVRRRRRAGIATLAAASLAVAVPVGLDARGGSPAASVYADGSPTSEPTRGPVAQQLQTFCVLPPGGPYEGAADLIGPTGDPLDNCARWWQNTRHTPAPPLVAYQDKYGNVYVQAKDQPLPDDAQVLRAGERQDDEAIELMEALSDPIALGPETCLTKAAALQDARRTVAELGFTDWPVRAVEDTSPPDGPEQCWGMAPDLKRHVVSVAAVGADFDYPAVLEQIAKPLRASLTECWTRSRALLEVQSAVQQSSLRAEFKELTDIREVTVAGKACTTVRLTAGGGITLTLRGPAS